jgi:benzoylformate decarboxylase
MRGRTVFMDSLVANGVRHIFGNPGTTENPILDSLADYPEIEYVMHLHEGVAVGAAGYYAQASGRTGVVNLHVAPGLGNALGMLYGALKAGSPMVVTAGQQDTRMRLHEPVLQHDLVAMAAPVTKWAAQADRADELGPLLRRAFKVAHEAPQGPVFLALPIDVMEQETAVGVEAPGDLYARTRTDAVGVDALADVLAGAQRPVIIAGDEVGAARAHAELTGIAEICGAPVFQETLRGHVVMSTAHTHYAGLLPVDRAGIRRTLERYDVVMLLGSTLFEEVWYDPEDAISEEATVLQIADHAAGLARKLPIDIGVVGDYRNTLDELINLVGPRITQTHGESLAAAKNARAEAATERLAAMAGKSPMSSAVALHEISKAVPADVIVVDETITAIGDVVAQLEFDAPGDFFGARGGGIGQGLAGALGVSVANPDRSVLALSGDGSAMYSIQALWTAAHHDLDIVFVILSNREYRVLKHNLDAYRQRFGIASNKPYPQMDLSHPTLGFAAIAEGMGVAGRLISDPGELADAIREAFAEGGPHLFDVVISGLETTD